MYPQHNNNMLIKSILRHGKKRKIIPRRIKERK
jgi:hypothetical protein